MEHELLKSLDKLHATELGAVRIRRNLKLDTEDVVAWCKEKIEGAQSSLRKGKNWYVYASHVKITINAHSFTIITAHLEKGI